MMYSPRKDIYDRVKHESSIKKEPEKIINKIFILKKTKNEITNDINEK